MGEFMIFCFIEIDKENDKISIEFTADSYNINTTVHTK